MSYRWTRVPATAPPFDRLQEKLLPAADFVMAIFWSRPGGLSLRTTWVTPATLVLASAVSAMSLLGALIVFRLALLGQSVVLAVGCVACGLLSAATGIVSLYGIRQRLLR